MINQQKTELKKFSIKNTKFFQIIDIYSQKIPLRFKGNEEYNTSIGFILGFLTLLFYFIISFYSLKDLFQRKNFSSKKKFFINFKYRIFKKFCN